VALVFAATPMAQMAGPEPISLPARAFMQALRELDWVEGRNIVIERRSAEGQPERAPAILGELVARGVDVIVVGGSPWLLKAAQRATRTIPVVALFPEDPVVEGYVVSLARPGGNLTGLTPTTGDELVGLQLQFLREFSPRAARVAFLGPRQDWQKYKEAAAAVQVTLVIAEVERPEQYTEAFATILKEQSEALVVLFSAGVYGQLPRIVAFAADNRLPAVYGFREAVEAGGLMFYGSSLLDLFRQMGGLVDRVLNGAKPADLPVLRPSKFDLTINLKTAKAQGLTVPLTLMARANEVIE
jgi:putative ABC transport system substrate-binding protein